MEMYCKTKPIIVSKSLSAFPKILTLSDSNEPKIFWLHRNSYNSVVIANDIEDHSKSKEEHKEVTVDNDCTTRLKCFDFKSMVLIVVSTHTAVKFFSQNNELIFTFAFESIVEDKNQQLYGTGIASLDSTVVCVAANDGSLLLFSVEQNKIEFSKRLPPRKADRAITDLVSDRKTKLVVAHDCGSISVCDYQVNEQNLEERAILAANDQVSCNCVALLNNYLWAGYGSGHLRVFDITEKVLICEISAHSKWITALDVAPQTGLVLSTSEDSFARVWQMSEENDSIEVRHKFSESVTNHMLFGGVFLDPSGQSFCVGGYDSTVLQRFRCESGL